MNKHNFKKTDVTDKALYKLWVKYLPQFVTSKLPQIKVYYSYDKPGQPQAGYKKLLLLVYERLHKINIAILYDNQTNKEIKRFGNEQKH
ncbi:MAG: hypothetical protein JWO58_2828 [Chitinophagaceae bacterium]|nr:hypothetical protein [Chitinophagaceae bacterium]